MENKRIDITTTEMYINLITSFSYVDRSLKSFLAFVYRDIIADKTLAKLNHDVYENDYCITFTLENKEIDLIIKKDKTYMLFNYEGYKKNIFETDTKEFFRTFENYNKVLDEIKNRIKKYTENKNEN